METKPAPETIISGFAVVPDETLDPFGVFLFHVWDEKDRNGKITQPAGFKLPGGRHEKPRDETPRHTAQNETLLEIGLEVEPAESFPRSQYGEALRESKIKTDEDGTFHLKVYTFFMKRIGDKRKKNTEPNEGGARGSFSLADILRMPLARDIETGEKNAYGIHHSARRRIFITLRRAGCDFLKLIPDLPQLINEIDQKKVGDDVYWILKDALNDKNRADEPLSSTLIDEPDWVGSTDPPETDPKPIIVLDSWAYWWSKTPRGWDGYSKEIVSVP